MKQKLIASCILPMLLLSSCNFNMFKSSVSKKVAVYNLDLLKEDEEDLANCEQESIHARFISGQGYIPFLTLKQYASLYSSHLSDNVASSVSRYGSSLSWTVSYGDRYYFYTIIDFSSKEVTVGGSLESAFKGDDNPKDIKALTHGMNTDYSLVFEGSSVSVYSFDSIKLDYFTYGGEYYLPLSFFDISYSYNSGIYFFYNYHHIYSSHDADAFEEVTFKDNGAIYTVDSQMETTYVSYLMPTYLKQYNAHMFFYLFDNFYGFPEKINGNNRYTNGVSMAKFCKEKGLYRDLLSNSASVRAQAYSDAVSYFDDNHTAIISANGTWGEDVFSRFKYSNGCRARSTLRENLRDERNRAYRDLGTPGETVLYSNDGKTAVMMFDSFSFGSSEEVFDEDGHVNYESATRVDTYFKLIKTFDAIKEHGGVENVVLDISTNGGGVLGVMMKLLSLMSKDNSSTIHYMDDTTNTVEQAITKIDSNDDGVYDNNDCYGDDFDFYILTSDCSFSCGNAFPCYAKHNNIAKIMGQKSGGGECAVAIHYLPNSQYVYHSSNLHLGTFDQSKYGFNGFEDGAEVDIAIDEINNFYDVEYLNTSINQYNSQSN